MKNYLNKIAIGLSVLPVLFLPSLALAQTGLSQAASNLSGVAPQLGTSGGVIELPTLVGNLINVVLGTMGIVFVILIVYAGILYMQAGTNPENAKKAKQLIINSVIGLVIIVAAYAIASFIIAQITYVASGSANQTTPSASPL